MSVITVIVQREGMKIDEREKQFTDWNFGAKEGREMEPLIGCI